MLEDGQPLAFCEEQAKAVLQEKAITFQVDLQAGAETATAWGCDLSHEYVSINSSYRS
jgi:glutamate N-acetyltransferase/amino-acid N-acetyltransferase